MNWLGRPEEPGVGTDSGPMCPRQLCDHCGLAWAWGTENSFVSLEKVDGGAWAGVLCSSNTIQTSSKLKHGFGNLGEMDCRQLRVLMSSVELRNAWTPGSDPFLV